jgi:hypothetical protein
MGEGCGGGGIGSDMKPRREPRAATIKDYVVALALLVGTLFFVLVVADVGFILKLNGWLILSAILLLILAYPFALNWSDMKVAIRRRRGRCTTCGYDRHGLAEGAPCPECGGPSADQ